MGIFYFIEIVLVIALILLIISYYRKKDKANKENYIIGGVVLITMMVFVNLFSMMIFNQAAKPIIYLYPEQTTEISVTLGKPENVTCSYPKYEDGWNVIANPDGTLIDNKTGRNLYALYWEGIDTKDTKIDEGFVVKSEDTVEFLEEKLAILGLNEREAEEFIVYWLPKLQENKYNLIRFATNEEIEEVMPLKFSKQPDSLIRVLMQYKGLNTYKEVQEQKLVTPQRTGFVAVEWGGMKIK